MKDTPRSVECEAAVGRYPRTFVEHVQWLARLRPLDTAVVVFGDRGADGQDRRVSYGELDLRVRAVAAALQRRGLARGERVLLMLEGTDHYMVGFLACQFAGLIAVPVFPPPSSRSQHLARLVGIADDAQPACVLTTRAVVDAAASVTATLRAGGVLAIDAVDVAQADAWTPHEPDDDDLAFLQYTSGSTSAPKGVMVSHANLMANERAITEALRSGPNDVFVSWLPPFHDMGLIGGLLLPLYNGAPLVLMTPESFLERPVRWLKAISRYRGTISGGPDFAYRLCVERIKPSQRQDLDLSSWALAFSGAEPVRHDTIERFMEAFGPCGLPHDAICPAYGLAEATLLVACVRRGTGMVSHRFSPEDLSRGRATTRAGGVPLVSCGGTSTDHAVRIVDPETGAAHDAGQIGEIWAFGPSISRGYWDKAEETAETLVVRDGRTWLRTGDLGFLHDGNLYVSGRLKDLIIVRGHNIYPQDIEAAVESQLDLVRKGRIAAFAADGIGGEGIGLAVEVSRATQKLVSPSALVDALGAAVIDACGEGLAVVVLLNPGGMPKTSSGKLQRSACRQGWRDRSLDAYAISEYGRFVVGSSDASAETAPSPADDVEIELASIWKAVLETDTSASIGREQSFFAAGGNSLTAVQAASRIADRWEIECPVRVLFEQPTLAACAQEIRRRLQHGERRTRVAIPVLSSDARRQPLPLSHAQQRLWFLWQLHPDSTAYHISGVLELRGPVDADVMRQSVEAVVSRHEALRTVFLPGADGETRQLVRDEPRFAWSIVDLASSEPSRREDQLREAIDRVHATPFDLTTGPLLRVALIREDEERVSLAVAVHHIVSDGWSIQVMLDELAAAYRARVRGEAWAPAPLPTQYVDYASWQRRWLEDGEGRQQLEWWRAALGDEHPVLELSTDRVGRSEHRRRAASRHQVVLPRTLAEATRGTAHARGGSVFTLLLGAFHALLHRHTGQHDIRIGATANNRVNVQTEGVVGFFVNLHVQRAVIGKRTTIAELLDQTKEAVLGAQAHQDLPFEQLVEALQPGRDLSHSPLFRVVINHQQIDCRALDTLPGIRFERLVSGEQAARFDLALDTTEVAGGDIELSFLYAGDLFEAHTIERFADHYLRLLEAFTSDADVEIASVELLSRDERHALVTAGQPRQHSPRGTLPLHRRIEARAARHPQRIAVVDGGVSVTYAELDARANRVAHALADRGVGRETMVGLAAERSIDLVVAIVAILKAGAGYVPLDPHYPRDRVAYMVDDSHVHCVLVQRAVLDRVPDITNVPVLEIEALLAEAWPAHELAVDVAEDDLAYVIYTSGSTGRPKGAQLTHRNVARLLDATQQWFYFTEADVWTLFHSYAFDFSVWEIFGALCHGGRLVVVPYAVSRSPQELLTVLREQQVTVLNQTPSAFRQLLQVGDLYRGEPLALRAVIFGGEALEPDDLRPWIEHFGDTRTELVNMYGITETTVHVTYRRVTALDLGRRASPIGLPIPDLGLHVLDERFEPSPVNVPGELHVSGGGLARGYLHRAGLTAERFVADPFDANGGRLYRTGDLACRRSDGQIDYQGRVDQQVKIRGFRIELGEIESRLRERADVKDAIVVAHEGADGGKRLVAYVVPDDERLEEQASKGSSETSTLVGQWATVFDSTYAGSSIAPSFRGWNSSYTDAPIPDAEMREWLDTTVARIESLRPRRILEIGCGVGLLVKRLAPHAERYLGTDLSPRAVADLRRWMATQPSLAHVELRQREAVDFGDIEEGSYDLVSLNSVVQYFPSVDYLLEVLRGAARAVTPDGHLFVGDVRHLAHLPVFHASVQLARARADMPLKQLKAGIARAAQVERELVLDPELFHAAARHLAFGTVRILLRRGRSDNELTRYRYDVVLRREPSPPPAHDEDRCDWGPYVHLDAVAARLAHTQPAVLRLNGVPNRRLARDRAAWRAIEEGDARATAGELRRTLDAREPAGVDPETLWALGDQHGYQVQIGWSPNQIDGRFDVVFSREQHEPAGALAHAIGSSELPDGWRSLSTDPRLGGLKWELGQRLREHLQTVLPDYMVPSQYCLVDSIPLTSSGKIDRGALPEPSDTPQHAYEAPAGRLERAIADVWSEVLGLQRVGRTDNFFELGGDSLLSLKVVARAHRAGVAMTPRHLFEHQTVAALAAVLEAAAAAPLLPIEPVLRDDRESLPLSHAQQRLWLLWKLQPESRAYHMAGGLRLDGRLDVSAVEESFRGIVARHEALRTTFELRGDVPVQVVHQTLAHDHRDVDVSVDQHPEAAARAIANHLAAEPFDLARGPLLRVRVVKLGDLEHVVLVAMHHIVSDGWSIEVLLEEFVTRYRASAQGTRAELDVLPIQYADFAVWQRRWLEAGEQERQLAYWTALLGEEHPVLDLPFDRPRQMLGQYTAAQHEIALPAGLAERVRATAMAHAATPFMVLLAALQIVLYRHCGQRQIRIGITNANRHHPELAQLIGFFVNTQALHAELDGRMRVGAALDRARDSVMGAQAHQDLPFDVLVDALQPERTLSHTPLFQVVHNHLRDRRDALAGFEGLDIEVYDIDEQAAKFELTLNTAESADGALTASLTYASELFDETTIERLGVHYVTVLQALTQDEDAMVTDIALPGAPERRALLEWGLGATVPAAASTVHERVERWARATPDATAVVSHEGELTYGVLNERANRLAHRLIALGAGPETRVGIAMERSLDMVTSLLAILKAGCAYVPLDPTYPAERLAYMAADSGIALLVTHDVLRSTLSVGGRVALVAVDTLDLSAESGQNPVVDRHVDGLAYVIYTSGSTGVPKGVEVTHRAIGRLVDSADYARLDADVRMLQYAPLAFDASTFEIWGSLCNGGVLVQAPPGATTFEALAGVVERHGVDTAFLTTALFNALAESQPVMLASLRQLLTGGEAMSAHHAREALDICREHALIHVYGPTECTTFAASHRVERVDVSQARVPFGRPIVGTTVYVLDADLQLVPHGVTGELYIGGPRLARGYRGRPSATAERFVASPFLDAGERMYRTGDLVRWNRAGRLEFIGRADEQVKIRGFRIEPGEVEARLLTEPDVAEAVVVVRHGPTGPALVAYVVARKDGGVSHVDVADLRRRLSMSLPDYLMPTAIVPLPSLPLNANGKVDKRSLPDPGIGDAVDHEPPQTETEKQLADIWSELLSVPRIGRHDNFFERGGHSLTAARLTSRVHVALGLDLLLREVFAHPVMSSLAAFVDARRREQPATRRHLPLSLPLAPTSPETPATLSPTQRRVWLAERIARSEDPAAYNIAAGLALTGPLDVGALTATLESIAERHDVLRSVYPETSDGDPTVAVLSTLGIDLRVEDVPGRPGEQEDEVRRVLSAFARERFDITSGPLLRARLLRLQPSRHVLLLCVHHIVFDGWSIAVFINDLVATYQALRAGDAPSLSPLAVHYRDYAYWQNQMLEEALPRHAEFWRAYLNAAPVLSTWPLDRVRPATASTAGDAVHVALSRSTADGIARFARQEGTSAFTVMLAAFLLLLHRRIESPDLVVGTDVAGRTHPDLEALIGFFVNVVPVRTSMAAEMTFVQWLAHVKARTLAAFEHAEVPFDDIVELSGAPRRRQHTSLVQVLFVMQNMPHGRFSIPGLEIETVVPTADTSKFDLGVFVTGDAEQGLNAQWAYATSLYRRDTIEAAATAWRDLLQQAVANPTAALSSFVIPITKESTAMPPQSPRVNTQDTPLVHTSFLAEGRQFPIVIEAVGADVDAVSWATTQRELIEATLRTHGGILFRNFGLKTPQEFEAFAEKIEPELYGSYGDLPKKEGGQRTYRSTPYPEKQMILFHNESSHTDRWPRKQWFFCELPSPVGGATPIVDCREMLRRLPQALVEQFERKELLYVRTFTPGLDVSWQHFYKTDRREDVEARLRLAGISWRWLDEDTLQTRTRCPAVITHPVTGEKVFFNQVQLHHISCLEPDVREDLLDMVGADQMPRNVQYGDGSPIDDETMAIVGRTYEECAVRFEWRQGDVVMLDNMLAAHARDPYEGPRKIVVAMGAMYDRASLDHPGQTSTVPSDADMAR